MAKEIKTVPANEVGKKTKLNIAQVLKNDKDELINGKIFQGDLAKARKELESGKDCMVIPAVETKTLETVR